MATAGEQRQARPKRVAGRGMGVVGQGIEKQIGQGQPRQMPVERRVRGKDQAITCHAVTFRFRPQMRRPCAVAFHQPQHAAIDRFQDPHPQGEHVGREFVALVEIAEDEVLRRQAMFAADGAAFGNGAPVVIDLIAVRQPDHLFGVEFPLRFGDHNPVGEDVIDIGRAQRAGKTKIINLDGRGPLGEYTHPLLAEIAIEIDQDVDLLLEDQFARLPVFTTKYRRCGRTRLPTAGAWGSRHPCHCQRRRPRIRRGHGADKDRPRDIGWPGRGIRRKGSPRGFCGVRGPVQSRAKEQADIARHESWRRREIGSDSGDRLIGKGFNDPFARPHALVDPGFQRGEIAPVAAIHLQMQEIAQRIVQIGIQRHGFFHHPAQADSG